jgi:TPR repeat protein
MYDQGEGVPQDYELAVAWYRKAADQDRDYAETSLAMMYDQGHGVPQDYAQAAAWYCKAVAHRDAGALLRLGWLCSTSHGVPKNYIQAYVYFNLAAGRSEDTFVREASVKYRDKLAATMTPAQIAEAQRMARVEADAGSALIINMVRD